MVLTATAGAIHKYSLPIMVSAGHVYFLLHQIEEQEARMAIGNARAFSHGHSKN